MCRSITSRFAGVARTTAKLNHTLQMIQDALYIPYDVSDRNNNANNGNFSV